MNIMVEQNVECRLRDGIVLRANVYCPQTGGPYPVLLTRLPYGKDTNMAYAALDPVRLATAGYIVVVQDVRGRFASEGIFHNASQEFADGWDAVEWASRLPGANGDVGMFGLSYFGFTQWAAAASGHPALKALVPAVALDSMWAASVRSGAVEWGMMASWQLGAIAPFEFTRMRGGQPDFPADFRTLVSAYDHLAEVGYLQLPLTSLAPLQSLQILPEFIDQLARPAYDATWAQMSARSYYETLQANAYLIGGWYDVFLGNTLLSYERLQQAGRTPRLLIGPWSHTNWSGTFCNRDFGMAAGSSFIDLQQDLTTIHQRWFDNQLKGADNELAKDPPVKIFVMGENKWRFAETWPLSCTISVPYFLHSDGDANGRAGNGQLLREPPGFEPADHYRYDPSDPVPTCGGNLLMAPTYKPGPLDQTLVETRRDVLVYTSSPLEQPLTVIGPITARLWVATDVLDTDFVVRLVDVCPDGLAYPLADGIVRMRARTEPATLPPLEPTEIYEIAVDCWATANVFLKGHCIRVQITSSCFPRWNRNLNTGASNETTTAFITAQQIIFHDTSHPSHIMLPIISAATDTLV